MPEETKEERTPGTRKKKQKVFIPAVLQCEKRQKLGKVSLVRATGAF